MDILSRKRKIVREDKKWYNNAHTACAPAFHEGDDKRMSEEQGGQGRIPHFGCDAGPARLQCRECGFTGSFLQIHNIDVSVRPEWKMKLMEDFFEWECPQCGCQAQLCYPCRYFDPEMKLSVVVRPDADADLIGAMNARLGAHPIPGFRRRLAEHFFSLREIVLMRDAGLDDRVVHLLKPLIIGRLQAMDYEIWDGFFSHLEVPVDGAARDHVLYMNEEEEASFREPIFWFCIHLTDGETELHGINRTAYRLCSQTLVKHGDGRDDGAFHLYGLDWAIAVHNETDGGGAPDGSDGGEDAGL